jgi:hypothetical protein
VIFIHGFLHPSTRDTRGAVPTKSKEGGIRVETDITTRGPLLAAAVSVDEDEEGGIITLTLTLTREEGDITRQKTMGTATDMGMLTINIMTTDTDMREEAEGEVEGEAVIIEAARGVGEVGVEDGVDHLDRLWRVSRAS